MLTGINHLTLAISDLPASIEFYKNSLGFKLMASWDAGAYLTIGDLWLCLSLDDKKDDAPQVDYTHYAFSISQRDFASFKARLEAEGIRSWKDNKSEGDSFYFLDPDGYKLEAHVGDLCSRLEKCRLHPYSGMTFYE
ncbi:Catechol 2,3-dioxygenase [Collimonas sp. OK242]|uniref:fosfomycin resistance glutathione transferase n=1 Tax=Collimonas sp. OK242 TaxID=1798195 RepID=UPI000896E107|nr:fosfomycin resistance glutathione transferase [Collimonas sp. OK242]SDX81514.1 Catechol 2,3-dioxygenase [Collimonas sp. OK242]